jgi:transposase
LRYCQREQPAAWQPPAPELRELRALVWHLDTLLQQRQAEHNRLEAGGHPAAVRQAIQAHLTFLSEQIDAVEQQIEEHFEQHPDLKRQRELLDSIKGIAVRTATRLLAELGNWQRFANARAVVAYVGLNPREYRSGSSVQRRTRLSKTGNAAVRAALYFPAIVAKQHNPLVQALCARLKARVMSESGDRRGNAQVTHTCVWGTEIGSAIRSAVRPGSDWSSIRRRRAASHVRARRELSTTPRDDVSE